MERDIILRAVVFPAIVIAVACLGLGAFLRRMPGSRREAAMGALLPMAVSLASFRALAVQQGEQLLSGLTPGVSYGWLPTALLVAAAVAGAIAVGASPLAVRIACIAAPAVAFGLLAPPGLRGGEAQVIAAAVASVAATVSVRSFRTSPRAGYAAWWLALSAVSAFPIVAGFAKLGFIAASLAASMAALGVLSALRFGVSCGPAMHVTMATALGCVAFLGMGYDEAPLPRACWIVAALAPMGSWAASLIPPAMPAIIRITAISVAPAAIIAGSLAVAVAAGSSAEGGHDGYAGARPVTVGRP